MKWFWIIIELAATVFENYIVINAMEKIFDRKYTGHIGLIGSLSCLVVSTGFVTFLNQFTAFEGWLSFITISIFIIYGIAFLKGNSIKKIIAPISLFALILLVNLSVTFVFSIILGISSDEQMMSKGNSVRLMTLFITKFLFYLASRAIICIFKKDFFVLKKAEWLMSILMLIITYSTAIIIAEMQFGNGDQNILSMVLVICIIAVSIAMFYLFRQVSAKNNRELRISLLEMQVEEQKSIIANSNNFDKEIKKAEHDLKHHFLYILNSIEENSIDEAKTYIKDLLSQYELNIRKYINTENNAVNSILNYKISYCKANNIDTKLKIGADFDEFDEADICVLLANLLDNAIEASMRTETPKIEIDITNNGNYLCILIRNKIEDSVLENNRGLKTTKKDKSVHGLGLYSVSQIVQKYDGIKNIYEKNGYFTVDVWLQKDKKGYEKEPQESVVYQTRL